MSNSIDLKGISLLILPHIETILQDFGYSGVVTLDKTIRSACPLHGGDNETALAIWRNTGYWECYTNGCHKYFGSFLFHFVRALLSKQKYQWAEEGDKQASYDETDEYLQHILNLSSEEIAKKKARLEEEGLNNDLRCLFDTMPPPERRYDKKTITTNLLIPSPYYLNRGYDQDVLYKYSVGDCYTFGKEMYNRAVVPIHGSEENRIIGCTGRSINGMQPKWKHEEGCKLSKWLYNLCYAKEHIQQSRVAILVEGPGDVWKYEENGIHISLGIFGCNLSTEQKTLLATLGIHTLILSLDNDKAGLEGERKIKSDLWKLYRIYSANIKHHNDVGDMSRDAITEDVKPLIQQVIEVEQQQRIKL